MLNVALIFHSTRSDNFGVGALTVAEVDILRRIGAQIGSEVAISVIDWKGPRAPYITGPDITIHDIRSRDLLNPRRFFALIRAADLVIDIGAGDSFADIYGPARLRRMFAMKVLTHLAGRPLVVAPQTVGPFTKASSRLLARLSLKASAIVASRDRLSTEAARALGATGVIEASDVALRLPYATPAPKAAGAGGAGRAERLGAFDERRLFRQEHVRADHGLSPDDPRSDRGVSGPSRTPRGASRAACHHRARRCRG